MSLFQKSVINRYLKNLDTEKVNKAYHNFQKFYGDIERLQNIMQLKEENYQEGFLREIFVHTLGYTLNPDKNYNLSTEFKNQKDSRKADGAILKNGNAIGVIELKSTKTKDLESIKEQAFGYKNNQPDCKYVITSNFQRIRFYIDNATEYEEFNLFDMANCRDRACPAPTAAPTDFAKFYLLLNSESILNHLPEKLKQESKFHDEQITRKLYRDYLSFKNRIFDFLAKDNPQYDKLTLFKKSQKLLDRFLFILFAEDGGLIPPNSISKIIEQWKQLQELEEYKTLYSRFQLFFTHLNTGHVYKNWGEIPAYNGGLFRFDEILDNPELKLPDGLLLNNLQVLSAYDFSSDVDVNILGHIFEHSLSEIEEMERNLSGFQNQPDSEIVNKRKKDGIFYTPIYITKYIIENTVGALCNEKKTELQINGLLIDDKYFVHGNVQTHGGASLPKLNKNGKQLFEILQSYKKWLLTLKILDPACGSGAFLNATLDFLIAEHKEIDNLISELTGDKIRLFDTDKQILENNIYGVDINEESVEISKLSLWLRTAQKGRVLSDLSGNIKCGNSLIDDIEVAGEKAFDWEKEFPQVFNQAITKKVHQKMPEPKPDYVKLIKEKSKEAQLKAEQAAQLSKEAIEISKQVYEYAEKIETANEPAATYGIKNGGFDVVLGNPPYVRLETMKATSEALSKMNYRTFEKRGDLYVLFVERGFNLLKHNGFISFIMPNKWIQAGYGKALRELFLRYELQKLIDFGDIQIFEGATTYPCIFVSRKAAPISEIAISSLNILNINDFENNVLNTRQNFNYKSFSSDTWIISSNKDQILLEKLKSKYKSLSDFVGGEANYGIKFGLTEAFLINNHTKAHLISANPNSAKLIGTILRGRDLKRYGNFAATDLDNVILAYYGSYKILETEFNPIYKHLIQFEEKLRKRGQCNGSKQTHEKPYTGQHHWLELDNNPTWNYLNLYAKPKIMYQKFQVKPCFIYDMQGLYCNDSMWIIPTDNKALLAILNSKMGWWLISKYCTQIQNGYQLIWKYFGQIPITNTNVELSLKADLMLSLNKELHTEKQNFINTLKDHKNLQNITKKLENFNEMDFSGFIKEIGKQKAHFALGQETNQWREYFNTTKQKLNDLQSHINQTDREIDKMVYELYELTSEEIEIVEKAVKLEEVG